MVRDHGAHCVQALRARPLRIADDIRPFSPRLGCEARHPRPGPGRGGDGASQSPAHHAVSGYQKRRGRVDLISAFTCRTAGRSRPVGVGPPSRDRAITRLPEPGPPATTTTCLWLDLELWFAERSISQGVSRDAPRGVRGDRGGGVLSESRRSTAAAAQSIHALASDRVCPGGVASTRVRTALSNLASRVTWRHAASCASKCLKRYASECWTRASSMEACQRMRFWRAASISSRRLRSAASPRRVNSWAISASWSSRGLWGYRPVRSLARCCWPPLRTMRRRSDGGEVGR